ncbi:MAG: BACON domain-containing carbohydrate-binding protein [Candidatus Cryptobacteroides sp.]|nr:BACON domain-containing carbohydrate-binding protein [Candidatus Cryptobacteroides sp.]
MKLKYIIASLLAGVTLFSACEKEADHYLSDIKVDKSYVGFPKEGGSQTIKLTAAASWTIEISEDDEEWLLATPASGAAGNFDVVLTALPDEEGNETQIYVVCNGQKQIIKVTQEAGEKPEPTVMTIAEALEVIRPLGEGDTAPGTFRIKGIVCKISEISTQYGNATYYLSDDGSMSGTSKADYNWIQVYRGLWLNGGAFTKGDEFGIGDELVVEGQLMDYKGTPETKEKTAYVVSITKSLIDVAPFDFEKLPAIDTTFHMTVTAKESPLLLNCDSEWLQIAGVETDGSYILHADENFKTAERTATILIQGPTALKTVAITQKGVEATGSSVSEVVAMEDNSQVKLLPSTVVVALTTKGAVLSDGVKSVYAYGDAAAALKVGDGVSMSAKKTTYNGVPELTDLADIFVDSEGNVVNYPEAKDITASVAEYTASEAEYIKFSGTLTVSGNYLNIAFDGVDTATKQGSIVYPVESLNAASFDGKKITVTGFFNGLSSKGKFVNIIATKIVEYVDNPKGTMTNPYFPSEIAALLLGGTTLDENVYIAGRVSAILYDFSADKGTGTFWISDDGTAYGISDDKKKTTEPTKDFECYSVYWFGPGMQWAEGYGQLEVGDYVLLCGKTTVYNGVAETSSKNAWVAGVNGVDSFTNGLGNMNAPFNVAGAEAYIDMMEAVKAAAKEAGEPDPAFPDVCVGGIISAVLYNFSADYGTGTFWISDDGQAYGVSADKKKTTEPTKDFECYSVYWNGPEQKWTEANPQPAVGDKVIVKGQLTKYGETYETASKKAWVAEHIPAN